MKKKRVKKAKEEVIRQLTPEELAEEERKYQACKKPVKIGWMIYVFAATLYICTGLFAQRAVDRVPKKPEIVDALHDYKETEKYNDFLAETQRAALDRLTAGEITVEEYQYIIETTKDDKNFEKFLRTLEDDKKVQQVIKEYDDYADAMNSIGQKYSALTITSLSSLLVATLVLAKYRFREMDIEEARKKRAEAAGEQEKLK